MKVWYSALKWRKKFWNPFRFGWDTSIFVEVVRKIEHKIIQINGEGKLHFPLWDAFSPRILNQSGKNQLISKISFIYLKMSLFSRLYNEEKCPFEANYFSHYLWDTLYLAKLKTNTNFFRAFRAPQWLLAFSYSFIIKRNVAIMIFQQLEVRIYLIYIRVYFNIKNVMLNSLLEWCYFNVIV